MKLLITLFLNLPFSATDDLDNLAWFLTFLEKQPLEVVVVGGPSGYRLPKGLGGTVHQFDLPENLQETPRLIVLALDQKSTRQAWIAYANEHGIPVLAVRGGDDVSRLTAWAGEKKKRFQIYANKAELRRLGIQLKLPAVTNIHLVDLSGTKPRCTTPNHTRCFPW